MARAGGRRTRWRGPGELQRQLREGHYAYRTEQNAQGVLRRVARGERLALSHRGKPTDRLEPLERTARGDWENDPFLTVHRRATASPKGKSRHADIDRVVYGRA